MDIRTANSSTLNPQFYWKECVVFLNDSTGVFSYSAGLYILFYTNTFELIVGIPLNIWLIFHILSKRSKAAGIPPADFFPFHLAITQVLFYLFLPVAAINLYFWKNDVSMDVMVFTHSLMLIIKPLLLCLVCVERYIAVVRPFDYIRLKRLQFKWGCLVFVWCIYVLLATISFLLGRSYSVCSLFIPILTIDTLCSMSIFKSLRKPPPGVNNMMNKTTKVKKKRKPRTEGGEKEERVKVKKGDHTRMKKKALVTVVIIQAMLTLNYMPFILSLIIDKLVSVPTVKCHLLGLSLAAATCFSYMQPLLYLHRLGRLPCTQTHRSPSRK